jgi:CheY-like chemotaxis protein
VPRILVADDNSNIQKMVALALEERGIDVVSVGNGEAAVRRIPDLSPDLVLADVFMPVRNGYEVCEFVKTNERFAHVPVILLVGAFDPLDEKEARRVGADGVLKKPFVPPDPLIAMVTSALEKNPHVAAEMEKAREAPAPAPPEPEIPAIALEAPARVAPKPLPDFPEPSPEEAALIYGFEKKRQKPDEDEDSRPRFSHKQHDSHDDSDEATTARDWRRGVADFEIPDDLNGKAISPDENFPSAAFPSEHETAPKRVPFNHEDSGSEKSAPATPPSFVPGFSTVDDETESRPIGFSSPLKSAAPPDEPPPPAPVAAAPEAAPSSENDPLPSPSEYAEDGWMSSLLHKFRRGKPHEHEHSETSETHPVTPASEPAAPAYEPVAAAPAPFLPSPPPVAAAPQWNVFNSSAPAASSGQEATEGRSDFFARDSHSTPAADSHPAAAAESYSAPADDQTNVPAATERSEAAISAVEENARPEPLQLPAHPSDAIKVQIEPAAESHLAPAAESSAPAVEFAAPTADSWFAPAAAPLDDLETADESASAFSMEPNRDLLASPADVNEDERSKFSDWADPNVESRTASDLESPSESESAPGYDGTSRYEQASIEGEKESPLSAASRDEHGSSPSANAAVLRGRTSDQLSSIFAPPVSGPTDASEPHHQESSDEASRDSASSFFALPSAAQNGESPSEPAHADFFPSRSSDFSGAESKSLPAEESRDDSAAEFAHSANEPSERIPTAPPPNREALSDIPFLTPPPPSPFEPASGESHSQVEGHSSEGASGSAGTDSASANGSSDSPSVDAVVNRLLEKLQPQIQSMLANDLLKPLVQNLLDQELATKKK